MKSEKRLTKPLYAFRIREEDKTWLDKELLAIKKRLNAKRPPGTKVIKKADIIFEAIKIGLQKLS